MKEFNQTGRTGESIIAERESRGEMVPNCESCQELYDWYLGKVMKAPLASNHKVSSNCKSGKQNHCMCDTCVWGG